MCVSGNKIWFCIHMILSVPLPCSFCRSSELQESTHGDPDTTDTRLPPTHLPTVTQNQLILEQGRDLALRGQNPPRSSHSKGPDTRVSGERSSLPAMENMGLVRPQEVSGSTFRRGGRFSLKYSSGHNYFTLE